MAATPSTYGFSERFSEEPPKESAPLDIRKTAELIRHICTKAHTTSNLALASLPTFSVFSLIIVFTKTLTKRS